MSSKAQSRNLKIERVVGSHKKTILLPSCKVSNLPLTNPIILFYFSCSRRVFGVIEERCICIVLDVNTTSESEFSTYLHALVQVLKEQVMFIAKFNLIRYIH